MIQPPGRCRLFPPSSTAGFRAGQPGGETLVPLHKPHAGQLVSQGVKSIQSLARLEADVPAQRHRDPDDYLRDALFAHQPPEKAREVRARHYLEGTGDNPSWIGNGDAGVHVSQIEGSDPSRRITRGGQGFATPDQPACGLGSRAPS